MSKPKGNLTPAQFEIIEVVWDHGESGATVAEIWQTIGQNRSITRTTVLNQVDRLERRGWLRRFQKEGVFRYVATIDRLRASAQIAATFVDDFFEGSANNLVMSLLGSRPLRPQDIQQLRGLLDEAARKQKGKP